MPGGTDWLQWMGDKAWMLFGGMLTLLWQINQAAHRETRLQSTEALVSHTNADEKAFKSIHEEQTTLRNHIGRLFEQGREESNRAEERHRELMEQAHQSHIQLLTLIHAKADKK